MYDVIVVGAGSAGAVLAARLSEDANVSVLLLMPDLPKANTHLTTVAIAERLITKMRS